MLFKLALLGFVLGMGAGSVLAYPPYYGPYESGPGYYPCAPGYYGSYGSSYSSSREWGWTSGYYHDVGSSRVEYGVPGGYGTRTQGWDNYKGWRTDYDNSYPGGYRPGYQPYYPSSYYGGY